MSSFADASSLKPGEPLTIARQSHHLARRSHHLARQPHRESDVPWARSVDEILRAVLLPNGDRLDVEGLPLTGAENEEHVLLVYSSE